MDTDLKEELLEMADSPQKIEDAFGCELQFGTGGLRGILGAGTNRMNVYVVRAAAVCCSSACFCSPAAASRRSLRRTLW